MIAADRLLYGQNWEDSDLEAAALCIGPADRVLAVGGGGCTTLRLLAQGPICLHAVDRSAAQLHLLLLKLAAVCHLEADGAAAFLGGVHADDRLATYRSLSGRLDEDTADFWRQRSAEIARGVISQGRVERFFAMIRPLLRLVHSSRRIEELFAQPTLEAQRSFFHDHWNTALWRALFLLGDKRVLNRMLDPAFYQYVDGRGFSKGLRERAARCIVELPIRDNYFLSWILRGRYGNDAGGRPAYLAPHMGELLRQYANRLQPHRADVCEFLRTMADSSIDKFYLSNVGEWLPDAQLAALFEDIARVARDGAIVCYRALMADRPLPQAVRSLFAEHSAQSEALAARDRAFINVGFHVVTVRKGPCNDGHA